MENAGPIRDTRVLLSLPYFIAESDLENLSTQKKERERATREITELIRNTQSSMLADVKELQFKLNEYEDKTHNEIDLNGRSIRRSEGESNFNCKRDLNFLNKIRLNK